MKAPIAKMLGNGSKRVTNGTTRTVKTISNARRGVTRQPPKPKPPVNSSWAGRVPQIKPGTYDDGLPFHQVEYLSCKVMLRPNHFVSRSSLFDFGEVMREPAAAHSVKFTRKGFQEKPLRIREVLFIDTDDFRLYNSAFILRRRIPYRDGFPIGDPEIVFKFRHPDIQVAAETDVRPQILGEHRIKFKCQALPLKEKLGGIRLLYSHNVQFQRSAMGFGPGTVLDIDRMIETFPVLARLRKEPGEKLKLVCETIIEEVLQDIGLINFGQGVTAKANVSLWRTRGEHRPLIGEFAYQIRFQDRKELNREAMRRAEAFFIALQYSAEKYIALKATKTGMVYRLLGNSPNSFE